MMNKIIPILFFLFFLLLIRGNQVLGQFVIYNDQSNEITGTWASPDPSTIVTTSTNMPYEGQQHYQFTYSANQWWAGSGLNMDNWGNTPAIDFSSFSHLSIAYRGMSGNQQMKIVLRNANDVYSNEVIVGGQANNYTVVTTPIIAFTSGSSFDISMVTEIDISVSDNTPVFSGVLYFDDIKLMNSTNNTVQTDLNTWIRHDKMNKGVNFANWLEAYWLMPFGTFPEVNKFDRNQVQTLVDLGFKSVRLPVTFERIADVNAPYTIPNNHVVWSLIDSCVMWAEEMDFTLIIDNHHGLSLTDANYQNEIARKQSIWSQVISRYNTLDPERYFFELYNEAFEISNPNLHVVMDSMVSTIRNLNNEFTLIVGPTGYNGIDGLIGFEPLIDSNIIYTFHSYDPFTFTHQGLPFTSPPYFPQVEFPANINDVPNVQDVIIAAKNWSEFYGVPIMLGEFGVSTAAIDTSRCNWVMTIGNACRENDIPTYYWDAITTNEAFGFIDGNYIYPCFEEFLRIGDFVNDCNKLVTIATNNGVGSLRDQLHCAIDGDTIRFSAALEGDTILLTTSPIIINKDIILLNENDGTIWISALSSFPLMINDIDNFVSIDHINLDGTEDKVIVNYGETTLKNLDVKTTGFISQEGTFLIEGVVHIKQ